MQHYEIEPPAELRGAIKCFWYTRWEFTTLPATFEVVPDGYAEIIFYVGGPCSIAGPGGWQVLPSPFMVGLLNQPAVFHTPHRLDVIGVRCFPWTVFDLLGLPAGQGGVRVMQHPLGQLQAGVAERVAAGRVEEAMSQLATYFLANHPPPSRNGLLGKAGAAMHAAGGTLPVTQVAAAAHATVRTLERQFKQAAGRTVKDVSSLMRFEQVRNRLWQQPATNLAGLAHELGYTDQAHLSREFRRYSGTTPAAFARKTKREQAAVAPDFVAFVQA